MKNNHRGPNVPKLRALFTLLGMTATAWATINMTPPAAAAKCIDRVVNRYPGDAGTARLRYGRVGIRVKACTNTKPSQWSFSLNDVVTNGTGKALGLELRASRGDVQYGRKTAYQRVTTSFQECFAWKTPLCATSGVMRFEVWVNAYGDTPRISVRNVESDDPRARLYTTP